MTLHSSNHSSDNVKIPAMHNDILSKFSAQQRSIKYLKGDTGLPELREELFHEYVEYQSHVHKPSSDTNIIKSITKGNMK